MIVYLHAYDMFDRGITWSRHAGLSDVVHIEIPQAMQLPDIVQLVIDRVVNARSIFELIINAHGMELSPVGSTSPAAPSIGGRIGHFINRIFGESPGGAGAVSLSDAAELDPSNADLLTPLRDYFSPDAWGIEFHSCVLLTHRSGWRLCEMLAQNLAVSVFASHSYQRGVTDYPSIRCSTPSDERGAFEGSVIRFSPDGSYRNAVIDFQRRSLWNPS
jgi:hypothetical protein